MQRRELLKLGLFGGGLLALGGVGLSLAPPARRYAPTKALSVIGALEFQVLCAIAARIVPGDVAPEAIAHFIDHAVWQGPPENASDLNRLLRLVENGLAGLLLDGRPTPFTRLDGNGQDLALAAMRDSRLALRRTGYQAIRKLCVGGYYARSESFAGVGYPGPPHLVADGR